MKYKCMLSKELLATKIHIQVMCYGCGRQTEITTDNTIGMNLSCHKCGSHGFKREVIP